MDASNREAEQAGAIDTPNPAKPGAELEAAAAQEEFEDETVARMAQAPNPVIVFSAATQDEGEIVRGLLESEGIPAIFTDHSSPILGDALSVTGDHMGDVLVATADVERAKALIESYQGATVTDDMVGDPSQAEE